MIMNASNAFICMECDCWMDYHELVAGGEEESAGDQAAVLCDFYSCPKCGAIAVPGEKVLARAA